MKVHSKTKNGAMQLNALVKMTRTGMLKLKADILQEAPPKLPELSKERVYELLTLRFAA